MAKDQLAPGFQRFEFRPGIAQFPEWEGLDLRTDASSIPSNRLRVAKNVMFWGRDLIARGGQSKLNSSVALGTAVKGIFETNEDGLSSGQKLWGFPYGEAVDPGVGVIFG